MRTTGLYLSRAAALSGRYEEARSHLADLARDSEFGAEQEREELEALLQSLEEGEKTWDRFRREFEHELLSADARRTPESVEELEKLDEEWGARWAASGLPAVPELRRAFHDYCALLHSIRARSLGRPLEAREFELASSLVKRMLLFGPTDDEGMFSPPYDPDECSSLAVVALVKRQFEHVETCSTIALETRGAPYLNLLLRSIARARSQDYSGAREDILLCESLRGISDSSRLFLTEILVAMGEYEEAADNLIVAVEPGCEAERVRLLALLAMETGKTAEGSDLVSRVPARDPGQPRARVVLSRLLRKTGDLGEARKRLESLHNAGYETEESWFELAAIHGQEQEYLKAAAALERANGLNPRFAEAHALACELLLAQIESGTGEALESIELWVDRGRRCFGDDAPETALLEAYQVVARNELSEGLALASRARESETARCSGRASRLESRIRIQLAGGEGAIGAAQESLKREDCPEGWAQLIEALLARGADSDARRVLSRALGKYPRSIRLSGLLSELGEPGSRER
ncbi:MAG: hypothetical protein HY720_20865 [Planctomycetes bacterium]|nr:hypothetical protein [Planctomycetota bacterium]